MRVEDIKNFILKEKEKKLIEVSNKKKNINSDYTLAKLDFVCIDNFEDEINVFNNIIEQLDRLQERIIERNRS